MCSILHQAAALEEKRDVVAAASPTATLLSLSPCIAALIDTSTKYRESPGLATGSKNCFAVSPYGPWMSDCFSER